MATEYKRVVQASMPADYYKEWVQGLPLELRPCDPHQK